MRLQIWRICSVRSFNEAMIEPASAWVYPSACKPRTRSGASFACATYPPRDASSDREDLLRSFVQRGDDRTGLGLGLSICMQAANAFGGELRVRDLPTQGCVFRSGGFAPFVRSTRR